MSLQFLSCIAFFLPSCSNCLPLSKEWDSSLSIEVANSQKARFTSSEWEHWEGYRDWKIDSYLSTFYFMLEFSCWISTTCKDSSSIPVFVWIYQIYSLLKSINSHNAHYWPKYFFIITDHSWLYIVNYSWSYEITFFKSWNFNSSAI